MAFANGAEDLAASSYLRATELDPLNPSHQTDLARVYLAVADRARTLKSAESKELADTAATREVELLKQAEETLQKAITLKGDYAPAHYYLAATFERQNRLQDAANRLAALRNNAPADVGLGFQLAMMHLRLRQ